MTQTLERFLEAAWHRTAVLNRKMIGLAHSNLQFGFELARAKTLSDVLSLQADYWQKQWNAFQAEDFGSKPSQADEPRRVEIEKPQRAEAPRPRRAEPPRAEAAESPRVEMVKPQGAAASEPPSQDQDVRPQAKAKAKAKAVEGPALADPPEKPKLKSADTPPRKAATPDAPAGRKITKGRAKPAHGRPPSKEARAPERKGPARGRDAVSASGTDKIQYGTLDGNAVRFTSTEAWALLDGAWKKVSAAEVLADAVVLSQARFDQRYPGIPQLPASAFKPKGKQNR